jgi:LCP family protein required for cell wall assembly
VAFSVVSMKTTLKRGVGRTAELNGNGRAVYPPPIGAPMRRYRQPEPERRGLVMVFGKVALWTIVAALMLAAGIAGGTYLYVEQDIAASLGPRSADVAVAQKELDAVIPGEPTTALVLGYDKRAGVEAGETGSSDTLMLVRADPNLETVTTLSFPRDLIVDIHGCENGVFRDRINAAYALCGSTAAIETVRQLTNVPINFLVLVDFRGFKQVVSHMGGVWMDVDRRYYNPPGTGYASIDLQPGYQKLNGQNALDYVRYRHTDSDLYRVVRQQLFVKAVKQRASDFPVLDLPKLVTAVTKNVEVGKSDGTSFDAATVLDYAWFAYQLPAGHVSQVRIDPTCYQGFNELTVAESCVATAVNDFIQPDVEAPLKATDVALNRRRADNAPSPSQTTVTVLNGNGEPGAAATAGTQLGARGYRIVEGGDGNAPSFEYFRTEVYHDDGPRAPAAARKVANLFGAARVQALPPEIAPLSNGADVTVIVGQTYHGTIAAAPADRTPERNPPNVREDSSSVAALNEAKRRVPFTVYAPTKIETNSRLDNTTPVRVYKLGDHNSIRLTYTNGLGDFWGIQMTDWEDAPALGDPNDSTVIKGRTYRLYYNGSNLHMVVLEAGGATYWVTNTILDKLSNETMLEIAKSLRPLSR